MAKENRLNVLVAKINFLSNHIHEVKDVFLNNQQEKGLIVVWTTEANELRSINFEHVRFWKKRFSTLPAIPEPWRKVIGIQWIYGQVMWSSDHTIWRFKYPLFEYGSEDKSYLNLLDQISDN